MYKKQSGPILKYYTSTYLKELKKATKTLRRDKLWSVSGPNVEPETVEVRITMLFTTP
jgi:hypothetical protein